MLRHTIRHILALSCALTLFAGFMTALSENAHTVVYLYENYCESCHPEQDFIQQLHSLTGLTEGSYHFAAYNTITSDGKAALQNAIDTYHLSDIHLPIAIVDGRVYQESGEFRTRLVYDAFEWAGSTDSSVIYLFSPGCESCAEIDSLLDSFPEVIEVTRGDVSFLSALHILRIDVSQEPDVARGLFDERDIPDSQRQTPAVFLPNRELIGRDRIYRYLLRYIENGSALGRIESPATSRHIWDIRTLWAILAAAGTLLALAGISRGKRRKKQGSPGWPIGSQ